MDNFIIATQTGGILRPFALILGKILEGIYDLGIHNVGFCIIIFTFVVRMLMLPMQIKQQKTMKLNSVMTPEIQAIQKKYQNRKDQQSQLAQQEEIKAVYDKYGTSPTGSCLQLIIQIPILFALYRVIMNIPAYVQPVKDLYLKVLYGLDLSHMKQFFGLDKLAKDLSTDKLNGCIDAMTGYASRTSGTVKLTKGTTIDTILNAADKGAAENIRSINNFFGLNLGMSPGDMFKAGTITLIVALIIPILAGLFQLLSVQLSQRLNKVAGAQDNPMASSMKVMNFLMPLMSIYMCWILSAGIGLYWMAGSLIMMLQQVFINIHMKKIDVNDIVEANKEKAAKKAEKRKEKKGIYREKVLEASQTNTRSMTGNSGMTASEKEEKIRKAKEAMASKEGSIASKAKLVNEYNKKNDKR